MLQAVIFDMDGTLIDTEGVNQEAWREALKQVGYEGDPGPFLKGLIGMPFKAVTGVFGEFLGSEELVDEVFAAHHEIFARKVREDLSTKPGAREAVLAMKGRGYKVAMASSTARGLCIEHLGRFGMTELFDAIACGDEVEHGKPAPDIHLKAAERLGVAPAACVVVEDSATGVRAARAAGMRVLMVPDLVEPTAEVAGMCEAVLGSLHELDGAVERLA